MKIEVRPARHKTYEERKAEWIDAIKVNSSYYLSAPDDLKNDLDIAWTAVKDNSVLINHLGSKLAVQCKGDDPVKMLEVLAAHNHLQATMAHKQEQQPRKGLKL